jgi:uncharacterized membrane protein (DUF373 family)
MSGARTAQPRHCGVTETEKHDASHPSRVAHLGERALRVAEDGIYVAVAVLLVAGALVLLVDAGSELLTVTGLSGVGGEDNADSAVLIMLDRLLLVFVLVELIFAVRTTLKRREIAAEPFLIVGIIASIKEIIVLSVEAANVVEGKPTNENSGDPGQFALQFGLLGLLVLVLAGAAVLLRVKENSPKEGEGEPV